MVKLGNNSISYWWKYNCSDMTIVWRRPTYQCDLCFPDVLYVLAVCFCCFTSWFCWCKLNILNLSFCLDLDSILLLLVDTCHIRQVFASRTDYPKAVKIRYSLGLVVPLLGVIVSFSEAKLLLPGSNTTTTFSLHLFICPNLVFYCLQFTHRIKMSKIQRIVLYTLQPTG